jgi:sorting nexin-25
MSELAHKLGCSKIRESTRSFLDETRIVTFIQFFRDGLWPAGKLQTASPPRTNEEKLRIRDEANRKLSSLVPGITMGIGPS